MGFEDTTIISDQTLPKYQMKEKWTILSLRIGDKSVLAEEPQPSLTANTETATALLTSPLSATEGIGGADKKLSRCALQSVSGRLTRTLTVFWRFHLLSKISQICRSA